MTAVRAESEGRAFVERNTGKSKGGLYVVGQRVPNLLLHSAGYST